MNSQGEPRTRYERGRVWENHHQTVHFSPSHYCDVWNIWEDGSSPDAQRWRPGLAALKKIIRDAEAMHAQVRAVGGGWSLSDVARTDFFFLNTRPLNVVEIGLAEEYCEISSSDGGDPKHLVFAQCGANIAELSRHLESKGLSLPTSGASNGQTICGALSTGTHGSAYKFGSIQEYVVGIHLVSEGGTEWWIEPASRPVANQKFCDVLGATLLRDDELYNAVLVSFGSFGIIHAVMLRAEPLFLLERHVRPWRYSVLIGILGDLSLLPNLKLESAIHKCAELFHFEVLVNPYGFTYDGEKISEKPGESAAYVRYMFKHLPDELSKVCPNWELRSRDKGNPTTISNDAFGLIGGFSESCLADHLAIPLIVPSILGGQVTPDEGTLLTHGGTFDSTKIPGHSMSTEMGFAVTDVPRAMEIIIKESLKHPFAGVPSIRYVAGSAALMAFTQYAPTSCAIELPAAGSNRTAEAYMKIWRALEQASISFTFLWGQNLYWGSEPKAIGQKIRSIYGERLDRWIAARERFFNGINPKGTGLWTFSSPFLRNCGIDSYHG